MHIVDQWKKDAAYLEFNRADEDKYIGKGAQPQHMVWDLNDIDGRADIQDKLNSEANEEKLATAIEKFGSVTKSTVEAMKNLEKLEEDEKYYSKMFSEHGVDFSFAGFEDHAAKELIKMA